MRFSALALMALASSALAQDPGPSPTASVGCEPHGDHWHCDGPASEAATESITPTVPSPTQSVGCEPHGDHWHCDGPASAAATATSTATASDEDHEEDHEDSTASPTMPSPTESVGCEPHGDHWHCDGPAETGASASGTSSAEGAEATGSEDAEEGAAGIMGVELSAVVGLALGVAVFQL
ncbi:hypothetical protein BDV59DRAFT_204273 [Aspergillus ambiguus]|uniref:uncharacterized protein n=1 Tax=Aspergillus ambiguus TaxID=176160 RepID=UPI003CCDE5DE